MLSYSNISVDGAIKRTYELDENKQQGKLIRYGYPKDTYVKDHEYLTSFKCACLANKDVLTEIRKIKKDYQDFYLPWCLSGSSCFLFLPLSR